MMTILFAVSSAGPIAAAEPVMLPSGDQFRSLLAAAHAKFKGVKEGKNADYIPYLAKVDSSLFGIAVVTVKGEVYTAGDAAYSFAIESISKPFTLALVLQEQGDEQVVKMIGVEPTGMPFNSVMAVELHKERSINPLVNAGAMATVSLVKASSPAERWEKILSTYGKFAGAKLQLNEEVYKSEATTNQHNRGLAELLFSYSRLYSDPLETADVYTKQCSVGITATQLATMGATLANGGINPLTSEGVLDAKYVPKILAIMMMAGFYNEAGKWAWRTGLPAKTGVGGGILAVVPGRFAIVGFSPPLDEAGNSVRAARAIRYIADTLGVNVFGHPGQPAAK
jgi:glutaminase